MMKRAKRTRLAALAAGLIAFGCASEGPAPTAPRAGEIETSRDFALTWSPLSAAESPGSATGTTFMGADHTREWLGVVVDREGSDETIYRVERSRLSSTEEATLEQAAGNVRIDWDAAGQVVSVRAR